MEVKSPKFVEIYSLTWLYRFKSFKRYLELPSHFANYPRSNTQYMLRIPKTLLKQYSISENETYLLLDILEILWIFLKPRSPIEQSGIIPTRIFKTGSRLV